MGCSAVIAAGPASRRFQHPAASQGDRWGQHTRPRILAPAGRQCTRACHGRETGSVPPVDGTQRHIRSDALARPQYGASVDGRELPVVGQFEM